MKNQYLVALITMIAITLAPSSLNAKGKPRVVPPHHTVIQTVSDTSITVKTPTSSKSYKISEGPLNKTEIIYKGKAVKASELSPGMRVTVSVGFDPDTATRITAEDAAKF